MAKSPAQEFFDDVVRTAVRPRLHPLGFRKSGVNFHRRHGGCVQVVNLQSSSGSTYEVKQFYVNVGLAFDELCDAAGIEILERPKEYECTDRGLCERMEALVPAAASCWVLTSASLDSQRDELDDCMELLAPELDRIDGVPAFRDHPWFEHVTPPVRVRFDWMAGDRDAALRGLTELWEQFSKRVREPGTLESYARDLGLADLVDSE